jgi:Protein of unknown function (DUF1761)
MGFAGLSYWAVVIAAATSFLFGGIWYGLLAQPWMRALGKTEAEIKNSDRSMPMLLAITFVAQLLMAYVLAGIIGHLGADRITMINGIISGALVWLGFVATTLIVNHGYQGNSWSLTVIDGGHWLGVLLIQGAVIGLIGVR